MSATDRRKITRRAMRRLPVQFARVGFLSFFEKGPRSGALAADVSETGVQIVAQEPLARWEDLFVILTLDGEQSVRVKGRVAWCRPVAGKPYYRAGIHFSEAGTATRAKIRSLLDQRSLDERLRRMRVRGEGGACVN